MHGPQMAETGSRDDQAALAEPPPTDTSPAVRMGRSRRLTRPLGVAVAVLLVTGLGAATIVDRRESRPVRIDLPGGSVTILDAEVADRYPPDCVPSGGGRTCIVVVEALGRNGRGTAVVTEPNRIVVVNLGDGGVEIEDLPKDSVLTTATGGRMEEIGWGGRLEGGEWAGRSIIFAGPVVEPTMTLRMEGAKPATITVRNAR